MSSTTETTKAAETRAILELCICNHRRIKSSAVPTRLVSIQSSSPARQRGEMRELRTVDLHIRFCKTHVRLRISSNRVEILTRPSRSIHHSRDQSTHDAKRITENTQIQQPDSDKHAGSSANSLVEEEERARGDESGAAGAVSAQEERDGGGSEHSGDDCSSASVRRFPECLSAWESSAECYDVRGQDARVVGLS